MGRVWLLGLVQGLTEFLPISSSGHLIILKSWLGLASAGLVLESWLHGGTLIAIVVAYRRSIVRTLGGLVRGNEDDRKVMVRVVIATIPAALVGFGLRTFIQGLDLPLVIAGGWLMTTLVVWATPKPDAGSDWRAIHDLSWGEALGIGAAQAFALWPGLSRSGATICAARRARLAPEEAARLSFWMAIPTIVGAIALTLSTNPQGFHQISLSWLIGLIVAAASGLFAIKWIRLVLARPSGYHGFGWYTLAAALTVTLVQFLYWR